MYTCDSTINDNIADGIWLFAFGKQHLSPVTNIIDPSVFENLLTFQRECIQLNYSIMSYFTCKNKMISISEWKVCRQATGLWLVQLWIWHRCIGKGLSAPKHGHRLANFNEGHASACKFVDRFYRDGDETHICQIHFAKKRRKIALTFQQNRWN